MCVYGDSVVHCFWPPASCSCVLQDGATPLMRAASAGHPLVVAYLISAGANVDGTDKVGCHRVCA